MAGQCLVRRRDDPRSSDDNGRCAVPQRRVPMSERNVEAMRHDFFRVSRMAIFASVAAL